MDVISLIKIVIRIAAILIPITILLSIVIYYTSDFNYLINQIANNPLILIMGLLLTPLFQNIYLSVILGVLIGTIATAAIIKGRY